MSLFCVESGVCRLIRYHVVATDRVGNAITINCKDEEAANLASTRFDGEIKIQDVSSAEWMDGLEFDTYDDAIAAYEMGEEAYKAILSQPTDHDILMALLGNSNDPMNAAQNLGNVLQVMAAQLSTSEL